MTWVTLTNCVRQCGPNVMCVPQLYQALAELGGGWGGLGPPPCDLDLYSDVSARPPLLISAHLTLV